MSNDIHLKPGFKPEVKEVENVPVPLVCSQRWILAYIGFLGFGIVYSLRVNISVEWSVCLKQSMRTELEWDQTTKSTVLASFFYGYIVTQIPGGWLADRYGGKRVLGITIFISSILTMLMPVSARTSVYIVYTIRVLLGLLTAVSFPGMHAMWGRWAPPLERSKLTTLTYAGCLGVIWAAFWFYLAADSPSQHPRITEAEKKFINSSIEYNTEKRNRRVPWLSIVKSPCLWACLTAHVCNNWTDYTLLTNIPTFMKEVLKFDIKANGAVSAIPYVCQLAAAIFAGHLADFLRARKILSTTATRKTIQILSFAGAAACLIATGFCSCQQRDLAVALLSLAVMFTGLGRAGYVVNHVDFAPRYAGVLYGITNTFATVPGMVAPIVAGWLTPNNTQAEWRNVFYVCAAFDVFGIVIFGLFASGEMQKWARDPKDDIEIIIPKLEIKPVTDKDGKPFKAVLDVVNPVEDIQETDSEMDKHSSVKSTEQTGEINSLKSKE